MAKQHRVIDERHWCLPLNAIREYGSADLLTPAFWRGYEDGLRGAYVFATVGDEGTLARLKEFEKRCQWNRDSVRWEGLQKAILLLEAQQNFPDLMRTGNITTRLRRARELMRQKR